MKIKEMSENQRPREKALQYGLSTLNDVELLALILQFGSKERDVFELAQCVLDKTEQLSKLFDLHPNALMDIKGIHKSKALQILASIELAKRALKARSYAMRIESPIDVVGWFQMEFGGLKQEYFVAIYLDNKCRMIKHSILFIGTLDESEVHPREIFKEAVLNSAYSIIISHNHPSGDCLPSKADIALTKRIQQASVMMGIYLADHIIIGNDSYYSFRQENNLD